MDANDSTKDPPSVDGDSTGSAKQLIVNDNTQKKSADDKKNKSKKPPRTPTPTTPDNKPTFRGPFGITIASTIIWYVCICILFVIGFISLILSILYFVTNTTDEQVIKLYGIAGSGTLTIITFIIIFLDCCNDSGRKDQEQEALYLAMKEKEEKERELAARRARRIAEGKEEPPKPFVIQHQRPLIEPSPSPTPTPSPPPHHHHHIVFPPPTTYHHPFVCPICHDLHASGNARHNLADVSVDTSDKLLETKKKKSNKTVLKSTRDAQTELWDMDQGTQTDRNEGTQTSAMELSGMPSNITQVIHETTIIKAPRSLLPALKKSMAEQDRELATNRSGRNPNLMTATIV